jgi:hypothetical protein
MLEREADLVDVLDRILDKGIVIPNVIVFSQGGTHVSPVLLRAEDLRLETDDLTDLFAFWRRDLWTK